ncbi:hypothetical protein NIE88_21470 [Sporolactobacillus shoreicorticis]|uniref:Uncharacterized protein n=1 Tax=Sporolactobacillus shoreicorticis TaxID=1923877 RepID=A0ABW5S0S3_9BACL|nr:hypothetical protein [Sporolactobacillus shoreicorticis]MCO7128300.1 hypothetical protein [Sporolactobacillus shoreicorticis]
MDDDEKVNVIFETRANNYPDSERVNLVFLVNEDAVNKVDYDFIDRYTG